MESDGLLLIDKPATWSSFDIVAKTRGMLKRETSKKIKVGHTGTLDPLATGLMIVVVGSYCKRAQEFSKLDKTYEVTMKLGEISTTGDEEGEKTIKSSYQPTNEELQTVLNTFIGESQQTPPIYSAIKINGKRAYKLAREGKEVVIEPRTVQISTIELASYKYPYATFTAAVSSGTYIRSLVHDIGEKLQTGAYMSDLRRTKVGQFSLEQAITIFDLEASESIISRIVK